MIVYFLLIFAAMSAVLSFVNWIFGNKTNAEYKSCTETYSLFTATWTISALLAALILLELGF